MGMTITEKILARHSGNSAVKPGQLINVRVDRAMLQDFAGLVYEKLKKLNIPELWDPDKVVVFIDHNSPPCTVGTTDTVINILKLVKEYNVRHFYNMKGVSHQIMHEDGFVRPGDLIVGSDSHTVTYGALGAFSTGIGASDAAWVVARGELWLKTPETIRFEISGKLPEWVMGKDIILKILSMIGTEGATYKAMEFGGGAIRELSIDGRLTICNMAVEAGAKNGIIEADDKTADYLNGRTAGEIERLESDKDCLYSETIKIDVSDLEPQVACPHNPGNVKPVSEVAGVKIDQVLLGSCTGGRMEDYRIAAAVMKGKKTPREMRCLVIPASTAIYMQLLHEGLLDIFNDCGCIICNSQCGPCGGVQMGFIGKGEACLGTHNRNFRGRMGSPEADIYLASPAVAAATALSGVITDPRNTL